MRGKWIKVYVPIEKYTIESIVEEVIDSISKNFMINKDDIFNKTRIRKYILIQHICMYVLKEKYQLPYLTIAKIFNKNHVTIICAVKKIKGIIELCDKHKSLLKEYNEIYDFIVNKLNINQ